MSLENYFQDFRENIIGRNQTFVGPFGEKKIIYADWVASGRLYNPIEKLLQNEIFPFVANTHTETNTTGATMNIALHESLQIIKNSVNASEDDVIISAGAGMTMLVNKFQRILGLKIHEKYREQVKIKNRPIVFVTHMEHHSNQTTWLETIAEVKLIPHTADGEVDLVAFEQLISEYSDRETKIAAVTSCSNVTGVFTPFYEISEIIHQHNGLCFVDFACSAPYIEINMHPENKNQYLDAIYFSPHKFLGGPGSTGILIFNKELYTNNIPDNPGGGTVDWTNPWGEHKYVEDIEVREDGGTPAFLQTIKTALCMNLKKEMGVDNILKREHELHEIIWDRLTSIENVHVLADNISDRLNIYSFYIDDLHFNLAVQLLNDRYGIQTRGGCSCAGTYGHYLLDVDFDFSHTITDNINSGDLTLKPGWVRMSLHPTMKNEEASFIINAIEELAKNHINWAPDYKYNADTNEFKYINDDFSSLNTKRVNSWFEKELK
ncbi:MAG: aminotransferase class V-fold PLP-dependent enzyme [Flavobacteriales bacterium]|jgi:selenocysteine lyase/cysteine desulfurase|nr:aminotransferase class V-fold PLP-dependent enzyme [Flavobacteriales bacterium]MBT5354891.1 aminotransferase class V-fold PLP-dependent enzyme [Flavobacteriales bacterium]MBT6699498.1 aminotransferase class V-fold PLP-dependent enzyme [Flavobacteriales bacterium]MBT6964693.1 aminotransferase class V-fold PLP-dependent enzyme [Flavobacteriales bacterium]